MQKYISKPDRKKLADQLGLKDSQVRKRMDFNLQIKQTNSNFLIRLRFGFKTGE